ncbi:hypothetical protein BDN67DRAFT_69764 [Paxillus ammoniavirescens]|nr:hypothetical protein BDN67DRAFT_69764 [Paxillus ammoniavirescens]
MRATYYLGKRTLGSHGITLKTSMVSTTSPSKHSSKVSLCPFFSHRTPRHFDHPVSSSIRLLGRDVNVFHNAPEDPIDDSLNYRFCRRVKRSLNACGYRAWQYQHSTYIGEVYAPAEVPAETRTRHITSRLPLFITFLNLGSCTADFRAVHEQIGAALFLPDLLDEVTIFGS